MTSEMHSPEYGFGDFRSPVVRTQGRGYKAAMIVEDKPMDWTSHNPATPRSTVGFFYPPSSPTRVNFPPNDPHVPFVTGKTPPIPSMPTLSAYNLHANINPHPTNSNEKFPNPPLPLSPSSATSPATRRSFNWRMILIFIALIPLPALLSAIYVILGAAMLSLPASLAASGAIGGVITTIPLVVGVYFLIGGVVNLHQRISLMIHRLPLADGTSRWNT
ncbi:hypothetical protein BDZ89DRAFT_1138260 [Hymenopellis radicata]|nr:hypothetical protein BDZ89DRAFT_1138260 [Hymenopellis radicata]